MTQERVWLRLALLVGGGAVVGALVFRAFGIDGGRIGPYLGILIIGTGFMAMLSGIASYTGWRRAGAAAVVVMLVGGSAEIVGLYTALPFGRYEYTDWWLPYVRLPEGKLYPLLLPPTWFLFVAGCYLVVARRWSGWALVAGTAVLAMLLDLVLEAVLTRVVHFWHWLEPTPLLGAPYVNALGWLVTAGLAACGLQALRVWEARRLPHSVWMFALCLVFTAAIGVAHGEPRGAVALLLLPIAFWARRRD